MHVQEFLSRLQRVKNQPGDKGYLASCPAHGEDRNPSLSIRAEDGKILLKCFTGCSSESIVAAMGLDMEALFADKDAPVKRLVVKEYNYLDAAGVLMYQVVRYAPKGFSQRRPDGNGGWVYNLSGITRVVYRLNELGGMKSVLWVEGEKDADRAWEMGIPATCNAMGAGKWDVSYAAQLVTAGVQRVAIIPDNDPPGEAHATTVAAALTIAGLQVRVVRLAGLPEKGDLSDYLAAGNTKDDLLDAIKATPRWDGTQLPKPEEGPDRLFQSLGEGRYTLSIRSMGLRMDLDHVQRHHRDGMSGELMVRVNGAFPHAKTYRDGVLSLGDFNLGSVRARSERANLLKNRSGDQNFDWHGVLEEFVVDVATHSLEGDPPIVLGAEEGLEPESSEEAETWDVDGFPVLTTNPMVLFGDSASGKSFFAMWVAGVLALRGIKVLYVDWEYDEREHKKRLRRLFHPTPKNIHYLRADQPITREVRKIKRLIADHQYQYLICDSIGFAVDGPAESHEAAKGYFGSLRTCGIGSLSLAHIAKNRDDGREVSIFGSTFFRAGARSAWFVDRAADNPRGELNIGLHHKKSNGSDLLKPRAYTFKFTKHKVNVSRAEMEKVDSLASQLPLIDRLKRQMEHGELYAYKDLAEDLGVTADTVRKAVIRSGKTFKRIGRKVGLIDRRSEPEAPPHTDDDAPQGKVIRHEF